MGKIPDALRARLAERGIDVPTEADREGDGTRMSKRARGGASTSDAKEEDALPPGWRAKVDPTYGKTYYYNKTLNKTQPSVGSARSLLIAMQPCRILEFFGSAASALHGVGTLYFVPNNVVNV